MLVALSDVRSVGPFTWRWPEETGEFSRAWEMVATFAGHRFPVRHALGAHRAYGQLRDHSVTWVAGNPCVEGVAADDYPSSRALVSVIRRADKRHARQASEIPPGYERFALVRHADEIIAPYSPASLAVKIVEDDLPAGATHALIRAASWGYLPSRRSGEPTGAGEG